MAANSIGTSGHAGSGGYRDRECWINAGSSGEDKKTNERGLRAGFLWGYAEFARLMCGCAAGLKPHNERGLEGTNRFCRGMEETAAVIVTAGGDEK